MSYSVTVSIAALWTSLLGDSQLFSAGHGVLNTLLAQCAKVVGSCEQSSCRFHTVLSLHALKEDLQVLRESC